MPCTRRDSPHFVSERYGAGGALSRPPSPAPIVVRPEIYRIPVWIDQQIVVKRNVSFALKERLGGVVIEDVRMDQVRIPGAGASDRKMTHEEARPGVRT